jgi:hypothetical protein
MLKSALEAAMYRIMIISKLELALCRIQTF